MLSSILRPPESRIPQKTDLLEAALVGERSEGRLALFLRPDYTAYWADGHPLLESRCGLRLAPFFGLCPTLAPLIENEPDFVASPGGPESPPLANLAKWRSLDRVLSHHCRTRFPGLVFDPPPSVTDGGDPVAVELWEVTREVCLGGIARARGFGAAVEVGRFFAVMQALS